MPYGDETRGGDTYLTTVEWKDHTAVYLGGDVEPTIPPHRSHKRWYLFPFE